MVEFTVYKGSKDRKIVKSQTTREIRSNEVLVRVTHSGLCGTDEGFKHRDMVLGHEGAGVVEELGSAVKILKKGDRVGWGYLHDSCGNCKQCLTGYDTLCPGRSIYAVNNLDQGSFASYAVWKEDFLFSIPPELETKYAAPLMCGGATVWNALASFGIKPTSRVGVLGVGGLGHLAIQFAAKMGCEVVVFSSTESKKDEALSLGAREFYATKGITKLVLDQRIDALLITSSFLPDWNLYLPILAPNATIYPLTVSHTDITLPYMPMLDAQISIQGVLVAPRHVHRDMLRFAAVHGIRPIIEEFPMSVEGIEEAMARLAEGKMRYRGVFAAGL
ncbi:MAG: hypothetical protein M1818_005796 [Claussenomyces sp. TS43310]|nr:MAG: hypothetical protein M1818_005796 [Claussenomyces sp. TS43310]